MLNRPGFEFVILSVDTRPEHAQGAWTGAAR